MALDFTIYESTGGVLRRVSLSEALHEQIEGNSDFAYTLFASRISDFYSDTIFDHSELASVIEELQTMKSLSGNVSLAVLLSQLEWLFREAMARGTSVYAYAD